MMSHHAAMIYVWIAIGGAAGAVSRALVSGAMLRQFGAGFPYGTFAANIVGSLLIGALAGWMLRDLGEIKAPLQALLITGFLGGFTTFSAFSLEMVVMLQRGDWGMALSYAAASLVLTVAACAAGFMAVKAVL